MGTSVQAGYFAAMQQASPGVFPATFGTAAIAMKTKSAGGLAANRDLLIPDPEVGGGRDVVDAYLGAVVFTGDYEFYARFNGLMTLLYAALGEKVVMSPGGTPSVHTLTTTGTVTGGTFTLTYSAQVTTAIPWNATAAQVQSALEALSNVAPGDVFVSGGPFPSSPMILTWGGTLLGPITLTGTFTGLTGTTPGGNIANTTVGSAYVGAAVHTFMPSDAAQLPFLSVQERVGASFEVFNYTDAVVNTFHLEAEANGFLQGTAGMIAKKQTAGNATIDPNPLYDNLPMVVGTNITLTYNGTSLPGKSFSLDINNQFEDDDFRLGSFYIGDLTPKRREVTAGVTIREQDSALWRQATYGSSAATEAGGLTLKQPLTITMDTYEAIPGATPSTLKYRLALTLPTVAIEPYGLEGSGDDILESDLSFRAVRPDPSKRILLASVTTNKTSVN